MNKSDRSPAPDGYLYAEQAAANAGISAAGMRARCAKGQVPGAIKFARDWLIPINNIDPAHKGRAISPSSCQAQQINIEIKQLRTDRDQALKQLADAKAEIDRLTHERDDAMNKLAKLTPKKRRSRTSKQRITITPKLQNQIKELHNQGHSLGAIAKIIGVSKSCIHRHVKKLEGNNSN